MDHTRMFQEEPLFLVKQPFFFIQVKSYKYYSIDTAKVRYSLSPRDAGNSRERIKIHVKSTQNSCEIRASFSQLPCIGKIRAGNFHT